MDVGRGAAVLGLLDVGMLENIVFVVNDRPLAPDQDDGLAVVQQPHLVRGHKLFTTMSSDEFKMGKKIPLLIMRRGIKCDIQKLDSQLLNNIA